MAFQWDDPFLLETQLSEDERMIRDSAKAFAAEHLAPKIEAAYMDETTDPALFRRMGEAGRRYALEHYSTRRTAAMLARIFRDVVEKKKAAR